MNTSSEPRESLVNGGVRLVGLSDSSSISEVVVVISCFFIIQTGNGLANKKGNKRRSREDQKRMIFSSEPRWKLLALPTGYSLANAALCVRVSLNVFAQNQIRQVEKIDIS